MSPDALLFVLIFIIIDSIYRLISVRRKKKDESDTQVVTTIKREERRSPPPAKRFPPLFPIPKFERRIEGQKFPPEIQDIIHEQLSYFKQEPRIISGGNLVKVSGRKPPLYRDEPRWDHYSKIICCFIDIEDSTRLSVKINEADLARIYRLFTETAVDMFESCDYYDVKGDGLFALYSKSKRHEALATTIAFKSFVDMYFTPEVLGEFGYEVRGHYGIDQADVLVRRIGKRESSKGKNRPNSVWAGQTVNVSAKLSGLSKGDEYSRIRVSSRFFENLNTKELDKILTWHKEPPPNDGRFDFDYVFILNNDWFESDGSVPYEKIKSLDKSPATNPVREVVKLLMDIWNQKLKQRH